MSGIPENESIIYTGFWFNHDLDRVRGMRLTLSYRNGQILRTVLVMLVAFAGNRSWKFCSLVLHCISGSVDEVRPIREQQVVLRNSETAGGTFIQLSSLPFRRKDTRNKIPRKFPGLRFLLILAALVHYAGFIGFALLTTFVDVGSLVRSQYTQNCGYWRPKPNLFSDDVKESFHALAIANELTLNTTYDSEFYVQDCIAPGSSDSASNGCGTMSTFSLPYITENVTCPFGDLCAIDGENSAFAMETSNISLSQIGYNTKLARKIHFARRTVCSPLTWAPFMYSIEQMKADPELRQFATSGEATNDSNSWFVYSHSRLDGKNNTVPYFNSVYSPRYELDVEKTLDGVDCIPPICPDEPSMAMSIFTLRGNSVTFMRRVTDAFFYTDENPVTTPPGTNVTDSEQMNLQYRIVRPLNTVACTEMAKYCSDVTGLCTPWTGLDGNSSPPLEQVLGGSTKEFGDKPTYSAFQLINREMINSDLATQVAFRGSQAMQASRYLYSAMQTRISDIQWKIELEGWFQTAITRIHRTPYRTLKTPGLDRAQVKIYEGLDLENWKDLCSSVKFRSPDHTTFSTVGIIIIAVVTAVLTILSFADAIWSRLWRVFCSGSPKPTTLETWENDEAVMLLMQRDEPQMMFDEEASPPEDPEATDLRQ